MAPRKRRSLLKLLVLGALPCVLVSACGATEECRTTAGVCLEGPARSDRDAANDGGQGGAAGATASPDGGEATFSESSFGGESFGGSAPVSVVDLSALTAGCGKDPGQPLGEWQRYVVPLDGETLAEPQTAIMEREIFVRLPPDYDSAKSYRVVYLGPGCGGDGQAVYSMWNDDGDPNTGWDGDPNAIYVGLTPSGANASGCFDERGLDSVEWESFDHDHAFVSDRFCIDNRRVYIGGNASGATLANTYSCYFGGIPAAPRKFLPNVALRGAFANDAYCGMEHIDTVAVNPPCNGPVAGLFVHETNSYRLISCAYAERDRLLEQNHCEGGAEGPTELWGSDFDFYANSGTVCTKYAACPEAYPVIFCEMPGNSVGSHDQIVIPAFTRFVAELEAAL